MNWQPFIISIKLASVTMLLLLVLATPVAYALAFSKFRGKAFLEALFALPLVLPPTVLGFFILIAAGNLSFIGRSYREIFGTTLVFSFEGLVAGSILYSFPFAVSPIQNSFEAVNLSLLDTARTLGCTKWKAFWRVLVPAGKGGIITAAMITIAHTMGEFGVVLMVGGSIPGKTRVASIAIYEEVERLNYHEAATASLVLLGFSFVILSAVYYFNRKMSLVTR